MKDSYDSLNDTFNTDSVEVNASTKKDKAKSNILSLYLF